MNEEKNTLQDDKQQVSKEELLAIIDRCKKIFADELISEDTKEELLAALEAVFAPASADYSKIFSDYHAREQAAEQEHKDKISEILSADPAFMAELEKLKAIGTKTVGYDLRPTSPIDFLFSDFLSFTGKRRDLAPRVTSGDRLISDRHRERTIEQTENGDIIIRQKDDKGNALEITYREPEELKKADSVQKLYTYILARCYEQSFSPLIEIPLQDLIDKGMYASLDAARLAIKNALRVLKRIEFDGTITKGKRTVKAAAGGVLFYSYRIDNNYLKVAVNEYMNVEFIAAYCALLPTWAYSLPSGNSFNLCDYIFKIARQNTKTIKETGRFIIGFKKLREVLSLPMREDIEAGKKFKPKQYVIDPLLKAIDTVSAGAENSPLKDFTIKPDYNPDYKTLEQFLEGALVITFSGDLYNRLSKIADRQEENIARAAAKRLELAEKKQAEEK